MDGEYHARIVNARVLRGQLKDFGTTLIFLGMYNYNILILLNYKIERSFKTGFFPPKAMNLG